MNDPLNMPCPHCGENGLLCYSGEETLYWDYETMGGLEVSYYKCEICNQIARLIEGDDYMTPI